MFLAKLQWQMPLYSRQIVNGCFRLGPAPFFCVLCCFASLATKRKSGWGICGSSCCVVLFSCLVVGDRFALWYWPIELGTTFHCLCLFQDRATVHLRPNSRKKNTFVLLHVFTCAADRRGRCALVFFLLQRLNGFRQVAIQVFTCCANSYKRSWHRGRCALVLSHACNSGILAGGIPGFGTVTFLLWHPSAYPGDVCCFPVDANGRPALYMAHKLPSCHHFSLQSDVDVSMHSTDGFSLLVVFVLLFCCSGCCVGGFALFVCFVCFAFGLSFQWIMHMASRWLSSHRART